MPRLLYGGLTDTVLDLCKNRNANRSNSIEFFSSNGREGGVRDVPGLRKGVETFLLWLRYECIATSFRMTFCHVTMDHHRFDLNDALPTRSTDGRSTTV